MFISRLHKKQKREGVPIIVTRSLQLTQKAETQQFKQLEAALMTYNSKNEVSITCSSSYLMQV
jgi:hypothetical protein